MIGWAAVELYPWRKTRLAGAVVVADAVADGIKDVRSITMLTGSWPDGYRPRKETCVLESW